MTIQEIGTLAGEPAFASPRINIGTLGAVDKSEEATKQSSESTRRHSALGFFGTSGDARTEFLIEMERLTHRIVIRVIDVNTKEVIREIPAKGLQQVAKVVEFPSGTFLDEWF